MLSCQPVNIYVVGVNCLLEQAYPLENLVPLIFLVLFEFVCAMTSH